MRTLPLPIDGQVSSAAITVATLWTITRSDATVLRFTDHDNELVDADGYSYFPRAGRASAKQMDTSLGEDDVELRGIIDSSYITEADLHAGKYNDAKVTERLVNWRFPWAGDYRSETWYINRVTWDEERGRWFAEIEGLQRFLRVSKGRKFDRTCFHNLGDAKCGVDVAGSYTYSGTVTTVTDRRTLECTDAAITALAADYLRFGVLTFTSGANAGLVVEVRNSTTGSPAVLTLQLEMPFDIAVGNTFTVTAGCDHTASATGCGKFSNIRRFGGHNFVPGNDKFLTYPDAKT